MGAEQAAVLQRNKNMAVNQARPVSREFNPKNMRVNKKKLLEEEKKAAGEEGRRQRKMNEEEIKMNKIASFAQLV